jgi:hypothetical protein
MSLSRAIVSIASIFLGLSAVAAQPGPPKPPGPPPPPAPLFQGIMVDAKGKTVGRVFPGAFSSALSVIRQINGAWVSVPVDDFSVGFHVYSDGAIQSLYQSVDCTGTGYFPVNSNSGSGGVFGPGMGLVTIVPPASAPSIYFAGTPASVLTIRSQQVTGESCQSVVGYPLYAGPLQSVPVGSLGLALPFSVQ